MLFQTVQKTDDMFVFLRKQYIRDAVYTIFNGYLFQFSIWIEKMSIRAVVVLKAYYLSDAADVELNVPDLKAVFRSAIFAFIILVTVKAADTIKSIAAAVNDPDTFTVKVFNVRIYRPPFFQTG